MTAMSAAPRNLVKRLIPGRCRQVFRQLAGGQAAKPKQFIPAALGIDRFFAELNERGVRYVVLRWVDRLPYVRPGGDVDLLVHDDDGAAVADVLVRGAGLVSCNPYSVSGLPGIAWHSEIPCLPPDKAAALLERAVTVNGLYRAPSPEDQFLSLAFHSVYHKGLNSGLPTALPDLVPAAPLNDYPESLRRAADAAQLSVTIDMESLDDYLGERGWHPTPEMIDVLARRNAWVRARQQAAAAAPPVV